MSVHFANPQVCRVCGREHDEGDACVCVTWAHPSTYLPADDPPISLPPGVHRHRRAEDHEEDEIRQRVYESWLQDFATTTPHKALMAAFDGYRAELALLALRRLGVMGIK